MILFYFFFKLLVWYAHFENHSQLPSIRWKLCEILFTDSCYSHSCEILLIHFESSFALVGYTDQKEENLLKKKSCKIFSKAFIQELERIKLFPYCTRRTEVVLQALDVLLCLITGIEERHNHCFIELRLLGSGLILLIPHIQELSWLLPSSEPVCGRLPGVETISGHKALYLQFAAGLHQEKI